MTTRHQYIDRSTRSVKTESLFADRAVRFLYGRIRENAGWLFRWLTSARASRWLAMLQYDAVRPAGSFDAAAAARSLGIDLSECADDPKALDHPRKLFERKIRYWEVRPMSIDPAVVVSPADSRVLVGSFAAERTLFLKEKFFDFEELLGPRKTIWLNRFGGGDFAVFRLTPDKYHYNHAPVSGKVAEIYTLDGDHHACNPTAVITMVTPYSKNHRTVTVIDTDVPGGTGVGFVAMVEVVALMIGDIQQCYSRRRYDEPADVRPGMFLEKGLPKSLYRPGSSTDVLIFEPERVRFDADLVANQVRYDGTSRFTSGFRRPLLETEVAVRASIGRCANRPVAAGWPTSGVAWPTHPYPAPTTNPTGDGKTAVSAGASGGRD